MLKRLMVVLSASILSAGVCVALEEVHVSSGVVGARVSPVSGLDEMVAVGLAVSPASDLDDIVAVVKRAHNNYAEYLSADEEADQIVVKLQALPQRCTVDRARLFIALESSLKLQTHYLEAYTSDMATLTALLNKSVNHGVMKRRVQDFVTQFMGQKLSLIRENLNTVNWNVVQLAEIKKEVVCNQ